MGKSIIANSGDGIRDDKRSKSCAKLESTVGDCGEGGRHGEGACKAAGTEGKRAELGQACREIERACRARAQAESVVANAFEGIRQYEAIDASASVLSSSSLFS